LITSSASEAKDYTGLNFNISISSTMVGTEMFDSNGNLWGHNIDDTSTKRMLTETIAGASWSAGFTKKFNSLLPYNRDAYIGWELGGTYLLNDLSATGTDVGSVDFERSRDFVIETIYRGHQVLSGGLKLGFNLGDSLAFVDGGGAFANILQRAMDYDDDDGAGIDFENSPHTQDLLGGYYIGGGLEYLLTENIGATFGIRHYNFASNEQFGESVTSEGFGPFSDYKYDNDLTQVQFGLVYYFRQK
jgi:hypothetical protein